MSKALMVTIIKGKAGGGGAGGRGEVAWKHY